MNIFLYYYNLNNFSYLFTIFFIFTAVFVLSNFVSSNSFKVSPVSSLLNFPFSTREIIPVSYETTITRASDISVIPTAALCLVPRFFGTETSEASGKIHFAASISDLSITIAPS